LPFPLEFTKVLRSMVVCSLINLHDLKEGRFQSSGTRHEPASGCGLHNLRENTARRAHWKYARKSLPSKCFVAVTTDQQARLIQPEQDRRPCSDLFGCVNFRAKFAEPSVNLGALIMLYIASI